MMFSLKTFCFSYFVVGITKALLYENVFPNDLKLGISVTISWLFQEVQSKLLTEGNELFTFSFLASFTA
jgi:hypothetical protein